MRAAVTVIVIAAWLAACGYKGPLYLPQPKPEAQKPAAAAPQKKGDDAHP